MYDLIFYAIITVVVIILCVMLVARREGYTKDAIDKDCQSVTPKALLAAYGNDIAALAKDVKAMDLPVQMVESASEYPRIASVLKKAGKVKCDGKTIQRA